MNFKGKVWIVLGVIVVALGGGSASADALRRLILEGNELLAGKKYDEALEKYRNAQVEAPESPYLYFNIANALEGQGKHDDAITEYRKVYSREDPSLGAGALYNVGVAQYRQAEQAIGTQDYQKALQLLEQCMESNREAMKMAPNDEDPKFNYEQAKRKWKEVLDALKRQQEEQKKQQDQQKQDQQKQDQQKQDQQKQDQQKQDQQKQDQQKQDQQKQDQQKQQQAKNDQGTSQSQPKEDQMTSSTAQPQEPKVGEMSPEDAERILNSLPEQNADDLRRFLMPRGRGDYRTGKDW